MSTDDRLSADTPNYGFRWGQMSVVRVAEIAGRKILRIRAGKHRELEVYVSPTGQSVRVWLDGRELR